ncbi:hypothetical protein [Deinococcus sp.]|uniref:hypothetical protein n=1 Tax=Deinococcus sp. TaxID=47478 RepID=UPI0025F01BEC|nr:hypothetical protein [Deinococcus sp.]
MTDRENDIKALQKALTDNAVVVSPGMTVYSIESTARILEQIEKCGLFLDGMDAIILHPDGRTQPDMENDIDLSNTSTEGAIKKIGQLDSRYHFELSDQPSEVQMVYTTVEISVWKDGFMWSKSTSKK